MQFIKTIFAKLAYFKDKVSFVKKSNFKKKAF